MAVVDQDRKSTGSTERASDLRATETGSVGALAPTSEKEGGGGGDGLGTR